MLLVEDEDPLRALAARAAGGVRLRGARSGAAAWTPCASRATTRHHPPAAHRRRDAADERRELADRLTRLRPGIKVLFMSGYAAGASPHHELPADAAFIEKPFTADSLSAPSAACWTCRTRSGDRRGGAVDTARYVAAAYVRRVVQGGVAEAPGG